MTALKNNPDAVNHAVQPAAPAGIIPFQYNKNPDSSHKKTPRHYGQGVFTAAFVLNKTDVYWLGQGGGAGPAGVPNR